MNQDVFELTRDFPVELQLQVDDYAERHALQLESMLRVDLVLVLLRINTPLAREHVSQLTGKSIQQCPSGMPLWPPKPVRCGERPPTLSYVQTPNPCCTATDMARRYAMLKVGMTREEALNKGVTLRDLCYWAGKGYVKFGVVVPALRDVREPILPFSQEHWDASKRSAS